MANRFFVNGGVDNNWGTSGNWSTTSGGAGGAGVPTSADDVKFDGSSPNCTIDASARVGLSLDFTGYTNTITFNQTLTITNNVTLAAGMTFAGSSALIVTNTCTFTSNGKAVGVPLQFGASSGAFTVTLADDLTASGTVTCSTAANNSVTVNGNNLKLQAGFTLSSSTNTNVQGTTTIRFEGTGTWSGSATTVLNPMVVNTAGTLTVSGSVFKSTGSFTYTAGTVVTTGSTITFVGMTLACSGITWNNVIAGNGTLTLSEDLNISGTFTASLGANNTLTCNGNTINTASFTTTGSSTNTVVTGTSVLNFNGTGTWSHATSCQLRLPTTINTAGTLTISGTVRYNTGTLTYTAGTIAGASTPVLSIIGSTTINFNGGTLDADLFINGGGITVSLASGMTIATGRTFTLLGVSSASRASLQSTVGGTQRAFILTAGAFTNIKFFNSTDMDSSGGQTVIWRAPGTLSNTINWAGAGGGAQGGGRGGGGGGVTQFRPTGASFSIIGNPGVSIIDN